MLVIPYDFAEFFGVEGSAADEGAVHVRLGHNLCHVAGLDAAAIQNAGLVGDILAVHILDGTAQ